MSNRRQPTARCSAMRIGPGSGGPVSRKLGCQGGGCPSSSFWPVRSLTRSKNFSGRATFSRAKDAQARCASAANTVASHEPRRFGPANPPSTKKTPSIVSLTASSGVSRCPPLLPYSPPGNPFGSDALTSVLSQNQNPSTVMSRLEPGKIVFASPLNFRIRLS